MPDGLNSRMIVVAREARGLSQSELSRRTGIIQSRISKFESGLIEPSAVEASKIAESLDFPVSFFCQDDRVYGFGSTCFYHRKRKKMLVADLKRIQAMLNIFRFQVTRLLPAVEIPENRFLRLDVGECGAPREIAREVRRHWNLPFGPVDNVVATVENAGAIVLRLDFGTRDLDAISQIAPGAPPVIFVNATTPGDRLRFSLMHEVGHIVMHQFHCANMEAQADEFAAEFLMPADEIKPDLRKLSLRRLAPLKEKWKVSMQALVMQGKALGQVTDRHCRTLFTQISSNGWRLHEPVEIPAENPTVFSDILRAYTEEQGYSIDELSTVVNANVSRFQNHWKRDEPSTGLRVVG